MANVKANYKINISGNLAELSDDEVEQRTYLANKLPEKIEQLIKDSLQNDDIVVEVVPMSINVE